MEEQPKDLPGWAAGRELSGSSLQIPLCCFMVFGNSERASDLYNIGAYPIVGEHQKFWNTVVREKYQLKAWKAKKRRAPHVNAIMHLMRQGLKKSATQVGFIKENV